jgi:hypothetical membrane protein
MKNIKSIQLILIWVKTLSISKKKFWLRIAGFFGILSPLLTFLLILFAINSYASFSWELNALSDLGVISGVTSYFFNFGLIIGGFLCLFFALGLFFVFNKMEFGRISVVCFFLSCCFLIAIGLFPENVKPIHYLVSVAFFLFLPLSLILVSFSFYFDKKLSWALFSILIAIITTIPWILNFSTDLFKAVAIPETISGLAVSVWAIIMGLRMLLDKI